MAFDLSAAADDLARVFDTVTGEMLARAGMRSDGAAFTVETARYLIHDPIRPHIESPATLAPSIEPHPKETVGATALPRDTLRGAMAGGAPAEF